MKTIHDLKVKIFADGANKRDILDLYSKTYIKGFTTNPTLMRKAGITDYRGFALDILAAVPDRPFSFEVFSDEFEEMERQAHLIASWGEQVYVKIPVTNTRGQSACPLVRRLSREGIKLNVTALMTVGQVEQVAKALDGGAAAYVSVFAGRVADTGTDPVPLMANAVKVLQGFPNAELIWASPRELLNLFHADTIGCQIITVTHDILKKIDLVGKDLNEFSLDTVKMFHRDASEAGFVL
jgi:transaldolase